MRFLLPAARAHGSASVEWMVGVALAVGLVSLAATLLSASTTQDARCLATRLGRAVGLAIAASCDAPGSMSEARLKR